nr:MAG TPA: recombination protein [Caudoviricetes sp.]
MNNDAAKPTDDQLEEIYELLELLPAEARRTLVGGYVSDLTAAQATAVIPRLRAAVKNLPRTQYCHFCGLPLRRGYCPECGDQDPGNISAWM